MIDVHCHLIDERYKGEDVASIVSKARVAGIGIIVNGTGLIESRKQIEIAEKNSGVWVCVGTAYDAGVENLENLKQELKTMGRLSKVVGIGEAGLNYFTGMSEELKSYQLKLFETHLEVASELGLPIEVHNREADEEIYQVLSTKFEVLRGKVLLHCFSGSVEFMEKMAGIGCYFSFGGMITYKKNESLREVARAVPNERLLLETDAPYLPPEPLRGTVNQPINVKIVAEKMAEIRDVSVEELDRLTSQNARRLFSRLT